MIIACLGNPGQEYAETRHNVGFRVADRLIYTLKKPWVERKPLMDECQFSYARRSVTLIKPMTYMNLSGKAVKTAMNEASEAPDDVIIVVDEVNFPTGRINLRPSGSDGGHNGIASVIQELGTPNFWRLRCGVSNNFGPGGLVNYVLGNFPTEELPIVETMVENACKALIEIMKNGPQKAMKGINSAPYPTIEST